MSRIRGKDTTPDKVVRPFLPRLGYRSRLHVRISITTLVAPKLDEGGKYAEHAKPGGRIKAQKA
jgi:hypothetical protein